MNSVKNRTNVAKPAAVTAVGVALFAAAIQIVAILSEKMPAGDFAAYVRTVVLPMAALVAAIHLLLFAVFRTIFRERLPSAPWRLGMALAVALGILQLCGSMAGAVHAVLPIPWALRLVFAGLSALGGLGAFAMLAKPARQRLFVILLLALVAASIGGAAYRVSVAIVHEDVASSAYPEKGNSSGAASSENAIVDYAETFVAGEHVVPRIVLITIDTLRRDALGCYSPNENSPNIDAFAKSAVLFENAWAPSPWTLPSLASLNTGIAPAVHGATHHERRVPERLVTLAEKLANHKYLTGAFVANRFLEENRGFIQGFHRYREVLQEGRNSTERVTNHALQWIAANAEQDFFLWLHYFDPHQPYTPPDEFAPDNPIAENFRQAFPSIFWIRAGTTRLNAEEMAALRALYDGEVRYVDDRVGRIFDLLRERGLFENALIIVTTDHGEEFWEHGGFEHGHTLYNELLKIPMLVRLPRGTMGGRRVAAPVSLTALYATILDVCGIQYDASVLSAASLAPAFKGGKIHQENPLFKSAFPMIYEPKQALLFEHFKYIHNLSSGREELYDLAIDPAERINLGSHFPKKIERARESLDHIATKENILRTQLGVEESETVELAPETRQELRDLGYF